MAWESRERGGMYYTRSTRKDGKVVREYIGGGIVGQAAATADALLKEERQRQKRKEEESRKNLERLQQSMDELKKVGDRITGMVLISAGYHHDSKNSRWRRKRDGKKTGLE